MYNHHNVAFRSPPQRQRRNSLAGRNAQGTQSQAVLTTQNLINATTAHSQLTSALMMVREEDVVFPGPSPTDNYFPRPAPAPPARKSSKGGRSNNNSASEAGAGGGRNFASGTESSRQKQHPRSK